MSSYKIFKNKIIFKKFKISKIIGIGSFGQIFLGTNIIDKSLVAIKVESKYSKSLLLEKESNFLSMLKGYGIPEIKSFGYYNNFYVLVEELLGYNLSQIKYIIKRFSLKDIAMMGIQIIDRIEYVHSKNILHRDIKPHNFVVGYENNSVIYIIDFGISRKYRSSRTGKHLKFQITGRMFGTIRFASYNSTRGVEQSRRDDLESIGYMLIYLAIGVLPWQGINEKEKDKKKIYLEILLLKKYTPVEVTCKNLPIEFIDYIKYCKKLNFEQDPDYEYLRNLFKSILSKMNEINDMKFSWKLNRYFKYNKNSKKIIMNKDKYINFLRRKESPQTRLFRAIQDSLKKDRKNGVIEKDKELDKKYYINIQKIDENDHKKRVSDDNEKSNKSNKFDIFGNSNISKDTLSFNSLLAHYNLNVNGFQDENKIYEENISRIKSIKNKNKIIIQLEKKNNDILFLNNNIIELKSYNYNSKNLIKEKLNLVNYSENNIKKKSFNISIDLDKNNLNISNSIDNYNIIHSKSVKIKNNIIKNIQLTNKDKRRQLICKNLYMNILNKMKKHINSLIELKKRNIKQRKNEISSYNILNYNNNKQIIYNYKNKSVFNDDLFSFKDYNISNYAKSKEINYNKKLEFKKVTNQKIINPKINQVYKKINPHIDAKKIIINNKDNMFKNTILKNKNIKYNNSNNIIINNSLNNKHSQNNIINFIDNKLNYKPNYYSMRASESNENMMSKNFRNKYFYDKDTQNYNIIKNQNNNINKNIKLIPNITKSITKHYFCRNKFRNNTFKNSISHINTQIHNSNSNLNNNVINNNKTYISNIKLLDCKPLYFGNQKSQSLKDNNIDSNCHRINSYKNIEPSYKNDNYFFVGKMKVIQINNKNQIYTSPQQYNYKKNIIINKNNQKIPNKINNLNNKKHNNYFSNNIYSSNLQRKNLRIENSFPMNNQKIYIDKSKEIKSKHYSPLNININSNYFNINSKSEINYNRKHQSFNKTKNKSLNFIFDYSNDIKSFNYIPKNINNLKTKTNNNIIRQKCFNGLKYN